MGSMKPQPKILTIWRIVLTLCAVVPAFLNAILFPVPGRLWLWVSVVWIALYLAMYLVYLPLKYQKLTFSVSEERILLYSGVLYTYVRSIPLRNIQFTAITKTPFDHLFGLCSLVVTAAGGRIVLPGLREKDAEALSRALGS